ncbi:MAG TPA: hypothetical protein VFZ34_31765 [Blastocatellia bacterium]|nr:hypothetical protein [Blastocatellia bacterium]
MSPTLTSQDSEVFIDRFMLILKMCHAEEDQATALDLSRTISLKLDLRAIQEVEAMRESGTDEDFNELLFAPKVREFLIKLYHPDQEIRAFWLLMRICYLALLTPAQRAQVIRIANQISCQPALLLAEFFKLQKMSDRIRLLSCLSYRDFVALLKETDGRALSLLAGSGASPKVVAPHLQNGDAHRSARHTFLAQ